MFKLQHMRSETRPFKSHPYAKIIKSKNLDMTKGTVMKSPNSQTKDIQMFGTNRSYVEPFVCKMGHQSNISRAAESSHAAEHQFNSFQHGYKSVNKPNTYYRNLIPKNERRPVSKRNFIPFNQSKTSVMKQNNRSTFKNKFHFNNHTSISPKFKAFDNNKKNNHLAKEPSIPVAIDVQHLFQQLLSKGMVNMIQEKPTLSKPETLKKRHTGAINALYSGWQCGCCGIRFPIEQKDRYAQHLDWHFRQNRQEKLHLDHHSRQHRLVKSVANVELSRKWYLPENDWMKHEDNDAITEKISSSAPTSICIVRPSEHQVICYSCHDALEIKFEDETDEWIIQNAIRVGDFIFHANCYEEYKHSINRATPSSMHINSEHSSMIDSAIEGDTQNRLQDPNTETLNIYQSVKLIESDEDIMDLTINDSESDENVVLI